MQSGQWPPPGSREVAGGGGRHKGLLGAADVLFLDLGAGHTSVSCL